ncbi:hypothetical protein V8E55_000034 [Tylopilus felleus]
MSDQDPRGEAIRVHVDLSQPLPDPNRYLHPPSYDADNNPVFFGSATVGNIVQPCKVTLRGDELICTVPHRLLERVHQGTFTVLPFTDAMELVPTSHGRIPTGCRPVVGGVDERGRTLYHAVAWVHGERVPGRTSEHLGAAAALFGGREHYVYDSCEILCWRNEDEPFVSNNSINQVQNAPLRPDGTRPGDEDLAGTTLRVTVSDMSAIAPYSAATDLNGITPLYFASATLPGEVLPGKAGQTRTCHILHNDAVEERNLGFNLLPFSDKMELVATSRGVIPHGRRPVEGNYDSQGRNLYHAILYVVGRRFPGMCAEHLGGAQGVLEGKKYVSDTGYDILCWKESTGSTSASPADALQHFSYKDDLAGQRLRKPLNGKEALTTTIAQTFGEHIANTLDTYKWFFTSVLHEGSITPSWAYESSNPCMFVHEGTTAITCTGPYCVLPFLRDRMVLVSATNGKIPPGTTPVEGGRDKQGRLLYHAVGWVVSSSRRALMIGMAAEHLGGAVIICWGQVHKIASGYELLCWQA